jgi:hypothetical protein
MDHPDTKTVTRYAVRIPDRSTRVGVVYLVAVTKHGTLVAESPEDAGTWCTQQDALSQAQRVTVPGVEVVAIEEPAYND